MENYITEEDFKNMQDVTNSSWFSAVVFILIVVALSSTIIWLQNFWSGGKGKVAV
jgi:hypothetical protein